MIEARQDAGGLFVKAIISDTQRGRDALTLLKDGAIGEMSIGYDTVKGGMDYSKDVKGNPVRNLREIKLYEFSLVTFPANEQATVTAIKQDEGGFIVPDDIAKKLNEDIRSGKTRWEMVTRVHVPAEAKPWRAVRRGERWYVYKLYADGEPTGDALGEHDTEDEAQAQVRDVFQGLGINNRFHGFSLI